jgi:hypothetical protein
MNDNGHIGMSQGLYVLKPKSGPAYPIPCGEWNQLKENLRRTSGSPFVFGSVGFTLCGAALATLLSILTDNIPQGTPRIVAWAIIAVTGLLGIAAIFIAEQQNRLKKRQVTDVVSQMELIEMRFEPFNAGDQHPEKAGLKIIKAVYGANSKEFDVTAILDKLVANNALSVSASNEIFQDPIVGIPKTLDVEYSYNSEVLKRSVKEGEKLTLP